MKPHYLYWIWAVLSGMGLAAVEMIYLAPIAWLFPPIVFGWHLVTGERSEVSDD